jgi:formylglycine-generating enzyme required for sulfatase activity
MQTSVSLLDQIGQVLLETAGDELPRDGFADSLPAVAEKVWAGWSRERNEQERQEELAALVQMPAKEARSRIARLVRSLADHRPAPVRKALTIYLGLVPPALRHWFRRPDNPEGDSVSTSLQLQGADELLPLLPARLPHFEPGDRPLPNADWELDELLGIGSFGELWKAYRPDLASAAPVALKFCLDPASAKLLRSQGRVLDQLKMHGRHPGIVALRQTYLNAEPPCLEYEYVPGGDLAGLIHQWHRQRRRPSPTTVAQLVRRLARVVGFAHRLVPAIVHGDLKPANLLVQRVADGTLSVRIADFGIGAVAATHAVRLSLRGATPAQLRSSALRGACTTLYSSPQQLRGADPDPRDDVYALGIIWYQLLTGDLTRGRPEGADWQKQLAEQGMVLPLIELLADCIEENPDDRPRNAAALFDRLTESLRAAEAAGRGALGHGLQTTPEGEASPERGGAVASAERSTPAAATHEAETLLPRRITNSINLTMMYIPAGTFRMGSPLSEAERGSDEGPQHEVTVTRPFYMGIYSVTQRQYHTVMGINPSYFQGSKGGGPDFPVESISWHEAVEFCRKLNELPHEKAAGRVYRLPTEAEWEYACRGGVPMPFSSGLTLSGREANFNSNYPYGPTTRGGYLERTTKVGSYPPNPFGLFDMHGNIWEWCSDYYDRTYYRNSPRYDPQGPAEGTLRVVRGGSCYNIGRFCRSAYRFGIAPGNRDIDVGMRLVMQIQSEKGEARGER